MHEGMKEDDMHFFYQGPVLRQSECAKPFYEALSVIPITKALSVEGMQALLGCDKLRVQTEDEAYCLLGAWLHLRQGRGQNLSFQVFGLKDPVPPHLSGLTCVITHCPLACESGLMPFFLQSRLVRLEASSKLIATKKIKI